ncbi:MAG: DUF2760 domain-containing protein, partial [Pseudolabrys sp.]
MSIVSIILTVVLVGLNAFSLSPISSRYHFYGSVSSLLVALALLVLMMVIRSRRQSPDSYSTEAASSPRPQALTNRAEAKIVSFLGTLQERGRLVDFLMEDITTFNDAQVGAAARVVHDGCRAALQEYFGIRSVREESEGSSVTVPTGYQADEYRLIGNIRGPGPFTGTLVHRGWKADSVRLPRLVRVETDRLPTIAPAEVEIK